MGVFQTLAFEVWQVVVEVPEVQEVQGAEPGSVGVLSVVAVFGIYSPIVEFHPGVSRRCSFFCRIALRGLGFRPSASRS